LCRRLQTAEICSEERANQILELQSNHSKLAEVMKEKCVVGTAKKATAGCTGLTAKDASEAASSHFTRRSENVPTFRLWTLVPFLEALIT